MQQRSLKEILSDHSKAQYKVVDDYRIVADQLEKEKQNKRSASIKLDQLQKKISCLEFITTNSGRESLRYQRKLEKLENTQNYATQLLKLKYQSFIEMQNHRANKHELCSTKKQALYRNRQLSQSVYEQRKSLRIKKIRQDEERINLERKKKQKEIQQQVRMQKNEVRQHQLQLKDRKKRYELFKIQQASLNYNEKLEQQFAHFQERTMYLRKMKDRIKKQEEIFRKTQMLRRQTAKIESIYLTGSEG